MSTEEAIKILEESQRQNRVMLESPTTFFRVSEIEKGVKNAEQRIAALDMAITALRAQTDFNGAYVNVSWLKQVEAERDAAMKYIPHTCETCKWWHKVSDGMMCCKAPEELGKCYLDHGKAWQWRGINDGLQRAD